MQLSFTIYGNPVTKKNSMQVLFNRATGKPFVSPSKAYRTYEKHCLGQIPKEYRTSVKTPVNVSCVYFMESRRKCDIANLNSSLHDILVHAGVLADDNRDIVVSTDGSRVYYDKQNPRVEVTITDVQGYEQWSKGKPTRNRKSVR